MAMPRDDRRRLRSALTELAPWLEHPDAGPRNVDAGQCDRCGQRPRVLPTCGPTRWRALCRDCGLEVGHAAWCDGHAEDGQQLLRWARDLPAWWGDAVVLWWVMTGEVAAPPAALHPELPARLRATVPRTGGG
jgi:hypothetical protein